MRIEKLGVVAVLALAAFSCPFAPGVQRLAGEEPEPPPAREVVEQAVRAMERAADARPLDIKSIGGRFTFSMQVSGGNRRAMQRYMSAMLKRDFPGHLEGSGSFLMSTEKVKPGNDGAPEKELRNLFLEVSSNQLSFLVLRRGDDLTFFSPQMNVVLRDRLENVLDEIERNRDAMPAGLPSFEMPWLPGIDLAARLRELSGELGQALEVMDGDQRAVPAYHRGKECWRVSFPQAEGGRVTLKVYADSWQPALLWLVPGGTETTTMFSFPEPDGRETVLGRAYLPEEITTSGRREGDWFEFRVSRIRYNPPAPAEEFALQELSMAELLPFLFMRAMTSGEF